ncbi:MAG: hypothetical protein PUF72_02930 [Clostridiales bacterium]|nr:hypothetical protein [Clostridiales bacterium]
MKLLFNIANQHINQVNSQCVVSDSVNYLEAQFFFSDDWDGFEKTAVFTGADSAYTALLNGGGCIVPHEIITAGRFSVSVFGIRDDVRITTDTVYITVQRSGYRDGETPKPPTPTVYEQILGRIAGADNAIAAEAQQRENADNEILQKLAEETAERKTAVELEERARCDDVNELSGKINSLSDKTDEIAEDYVSKTAEYKPNGQSIGFFWQELVDEVAKIQPIADDYVSSSEYYEVYDSVTGGAAGFFWQEIVDEVAKIRTKADKDYVDTERAILATDIMNIWENLAGKADKGIYIIINSILDLLGDCEILPVAEGVTEKIVIKRAWAADKYCVYAGDTPFTAESISVTEPTVTAKGGFEGSNITVRLYTADGVQISVVKLNIIEISGRKIGRMERI